MGARLSILPDPLFAGLNGALTERLGRVAATVQPDNLGSLLDPLMRQVLEEGFAEARAHEGTVWLLDASEENLVPAYNTGPNAEQIVGKFRQPLSSGLICMVFATEQAFLENDVPGNTQQSKRLDEMLGWQTLALIAVPFSFLKSCRGVVSCVQLKRPGAPSPDSPGFQPAHLARVQRTATVLSRLLELRLLSDTVGWKSE